MTDDDLFKDMLGGDVHPLKVTQKTDLKKGVESVSVDQRRAAAISYTVDVDLDPLAQTPTEMVDPLSVLEFKRAGVQNGVYRNVRLGKYPIDARLDLHRLTVEQARRTLYQFIKDCLENDVRYALVTHGKGEGREKPALLKSCVAYWLPQIEEVLAFHTAQKQHGSYGATYILLKKSERNKEVNRDQYR